MATEWFCRIMGDEWGPMSARELVAVAQRGRMTRDDVVRRGATGTWVRAESVDGLFDTSVSGATATTRCVAIRPRPATPASRSVRQVQSTKYWTHDGEQISGPFSSQKIRQLAAKGKLNPNHLVRNDRSRWIRAWRIPGLAFGEVSQQSVTTSLRFAEWPLQPPPPLSHDQAADELPSEDGGPLPATAAQ